MRSLGLKSAIALALYLAAGHIGVSSAESEFEKWMKQQRAEYQEYKDKRDKEFTNFLQNQWKELEVFAGTRRDEAPKPVAMPVAKPKPKPAPVVVAEPPKPVPEPERKPIIVAKPDPAPAQRPPELQPEVRPELRPAPVRTPLVTAPVHVKPVEIIQPPVIPAKPVVKPVVVAVPKGQKANIEFFGRSMTFYYDPKFKTRLNGRIDEKAISDFWSTLSKADYDVLLSQLDSQRSPLQANDWSYALLINELAQAVYPNQKNEQALFTWFMLIKAGYQARLAYADYQTFLLLPTEQKLYSVAYFTFNNKRYYAVGLDGNRVKPGKVFTYNGQYPGATKDFDMKLSQTLNTERNKENRTVSFNYAGKRYSVNVQYDKNTISYLKTYPQMDIDQYFASRVNEDIGNPLLTQLRKIIEGKSEEEAVNILLLFVQNAFKYKTDQGQFGEENYLFPEETMFYPYSDCEDRSIIFAWLVRSLTSLEVVGLDFPGHIAAAVKFKSNVQGDKIHFNGANYVVTDPTYINASAGMTMPDYKNVKPKIINFRAF